MRPGSAGAKDPLLPRAELLRDSRQPLELAAVIERAEQVLRRWEPLWTGFVSAAAREEALERLGGYEELRLLADGGVEGAERCRLRLCRSELATASGAPGAAADRQGGEGPDLESPALVGLEMGGNFLFDPAEAAEFRAALIRAGAAAAELGDLWIHGDRGAQLVTVPALAARLQGTTALVRRVEVDLEPVPLELLRPPGRPRPRRLTTVEASRRLDAVASAGFGVSRSRMAGLIRQGAVRVNWVGARSPSRELQAGDRVQLENRGELTVLGIEATKRERWRLELQRS